MVDRRRTHQTPQTRATSRNTDQPSDDLDPGAPANTTGEPGFLSFCSWLVRWLVAKPIAWYIRTLRHELARHMNRRPRRKPP